MLWKHWRFRCLTHFHGDGNCGHWCCSISGKCYASISCPACVQSTLCRAVCLHQPECTLSSRLSWPGPSVCDGTVSFSGTVQLELITNCSHCVPLQKGSLRRICAEESITNPSRQDDEEEIKMQEQTFSCSHVSSCWSSLLWHVTNIPIFLPCWQWSIPNFEDPIQKERTPTQHAHNICVHLPNPPDFLVV